VDDGRVEIWVQGAEDEVKEFFQAIDESHLKGLINKVDLKWTAPEKDLTGFSIAF